MMKNDEKGGAGMLSESQEFTIEITKGDILCNCGPCTHSILIGTYTFAQPKIKRGQRRVCG